MRKLILIVNAVMAIWGECLVVTSCDSRPVLRQASYMVIGAIWVIAAARMLGKRQQCLWAWAGSLIPVLLLTLHMGKHYFQNVVPVWQFSYGDRTFETTQSICRTVYVGTTLALAFFCSLLSGLLSLPFLKSQKST